MQIILFRNLSIIFAVLEASPCYTAVSFQLHRLQLGVWRENNFFLKLKQFVILSALVNMMRHMTTAIQ